MQRRRRPSPHYYDDGDDAFASPLSVSVSAPPTTHNSLHSDLQISTSAESISGQRAP